MFVNADTRKYANVLLVVMALVLMWAVAQGYKLRATLVVTDAAISEVREAVMARQNANRELLVARLQRIEDKIDAAGRQKK